jgi:hypothetical protein
MVSSPTARCHLWASVPHHEDDYKQLLIVIMGHLLHIMKMMMSSFLGACSTS